MSIWKTWSELEISLKDKKKVYLFGRSEDWTSKALKKIPKNIDITIVDNNKTYHNQKYRNIEILSPKILDKNNFKHSFIIICAEPDSIVDELSAKNFIEGNDFCCLPDLFDWSHLQNLKKHSSKILVSSSDYFDLSRSRGSKSGGGLFICDHTNNTIEKKLDGQFRQIIEVDQLYYIVEYVEKKIFVVDKKFKVIEKFDLDQTKEKREMPNFCGITYCSKNKLFFVANSSTDIISVYELNNFKKIDEIEFSNKSKLLEDGQSHINDLTIMGDFLLVSYFSFSGLWKKGIFDGGVSEINIQNKKKTELIRNLKQPHSPEYIEGKICVLDSMNRNLLIGDSIKSSFPGFVRGLTFDGKYYYVGQSEDMYTSQNFGSSNQNTMCNAGIYKIDLEKNISRFISMYDNMNIHDLLTYS
tara:strand:+ start:5978 stop:7216 length:1239 start_codon:yes stop_codon:yes gene_type:complete